MKSIVFAFCLIFFCFNTFAQNSEKTLTQLQEQIKTFKKKDKYSVTYNKFDDKTIVLASKFYMTSFSIASGFVFEKDTLKNKPQSFFIEFTAYGGIGGSPVMKQGWRFKEDSELTFLADNERIKIGKGNRDSDFSKGIFGNTMTKERLLFSINSEDFTKLAKAEKIEFQIGSEQSKFNKDIIEMFKNLYSLIN